MASWLRKNLLLLATFSGESFATLHCKKSFAVFPSPPAGMSLNSLAGNNLIIPGQGEFGK